MLGVNIYIVLCILVKIKKKRNSGEKNADTKCDKWKRARIDIYVFLRTIGQCHVRLYGVN